MLPGYCDTLDATAIATGWTETRAVRNKARIHVFAALQHIVAHLPFPLLGIGSANGNAEAFLKIVADEWAYGRSCLSNKERAAMLGPFLREYDLFRPHGGIGGQPPIGRLG